MNAITLKRAELKDAPALQKLAHDTFLPAFSHLNKAENMKAYMDAAFDIAQLRRELSDVNSQFYFAIADNDLVGYLKVNFHDAQTDIRDPEALEIQRIYVLPGHQNLKIGEKMLEKAKEVALTYHLRYIWLGVWENNPKAIRFYENNGFKKIAEHPFQFGDDAQTDFIMKLILG